MASYYDLDQIFLTGPVSCYHVKWRTKELLLFGDLHCPRIKGKIDLINFLELVANKTNENKICVDFFHELPFQKESTRLIEYHNSDDSDILIDQIRIIFGMNSKYYGDKYPYFRIHGWELSQYTKFESNTLLLWNVHDMGIISKYELIYNFYCDNKDNQYDKDFRDLIEKDHHFIKSKIIFDNEKFLSLLIHKQISNIDTNYFEPKLLFDYFKKTLLNNLRLAVLETYSIARMFRKFEHKEKRSNKCDSNDVANIIYFGGSAHVLNVFYFLKYLAEFETNKDIQFLYEFKNRYDKTVTSKKSCNYQQSIVLKLYNFFNLFPDTNDLKRMSVHQQSGITQRNSSTVPIIPYMNPEASEFIPQVFKQSTHIDHFKNKYLKYKLKYIKLKKSLQ